MNKVGIVVAALAVALGLSACGSSGEIDGGSAQTVSGQVADYDGPAGTLEATTGIVSLSAAGTGSIEADGTFKFELNQAPTEFVTAPIAPPGCADVDVSDAAARALNVALLSVIVDERVVGTLSQSQDVTDGNKSLPLPDLLISRTYANRAVTARGTCTVSILETQITTTYDVTYQQGWNEVFTKTTFSADGLTANAKVTSATAADIEEIRWRY